MAHAHFHQVQADLREPYRALTKAIPDVMAGYGALHDAAFVEGALDIKTKELIALSIAITRECDGCIAAHGRNLARLGATTEEVAEMIGVSISMNGGPGLVWGPRALESFLEYRDGGATTPPTTPATPPSVG
jgi:AhpD family alkylhydroperoxidase